MGMFTYRVQLVSPPRVADLLVVYRAGGNTGTQRVALR
jgi:hypothetical protein